MRSGIDAIVVNYRTPNDLERFVRSWEKFGAGSHLHVVQVDPLEEDLAVMGSFSHPDIHVQCTRTNVGYARAVNSAAATGNREILAIFNADTELREGVLQNCADALRQNPEWGVLGPRQVDDRGRITHAGIFGTLDAPAHRGWQQGNAGRYDDVRPAVTVSGSAYFIKRAVWKELTDCEIYQDLHPCTLGAFLPTKHYYEETWCSYHAQAHGHQVIYYGQEEMIHSWHKASPVGGSAEREFPKSREVFRAACDAHGIKHD